MAVPWEGPASHAAVTPWPAQAVAAEMLDGVKVYGRGVTTVRALDGVTARFFAGQLTAVMGPSGSGKSTLLHCLAGLDRLTSGRALLAGTDLGSLDDRSMTLLRREQVGFIFQAYNLVPTLSAEENIVLPLRLARRKPDREWVQALAALLGIADRLGHRPSELSGGQQQRVATARALVTRPRLVFADEPTGNLDSSSATRLLGQLRAAVDDFHQSVVVVTHDPRVAEYADRALFLADGQVAYTMNEPTSEAVLDLLAGLSRPRPRHAR